MKRSIFVFVGALLICAHSGKSADSLSAKTDIGRALEIYLIHGLDINYLHPVSPGNFRRMNLSVTAGKLKSNSSSDSENKSDTSEKRTKSNSDLRQDNQHLTISIQYLHALYAKHFFRVYAGIGPYIGLSREYYEDNRTFFQNDTITSKYNRTTYGSNLGAKLIGGLSSSFNDRLYLFAEYQLYLAYNWSKSDSKDSQGSINNSQRYVHKYIRHTSGWSAGLSGIKVGIGFHF